MRKTSLTYVTLTLIAGSIIFGILFFGSKSLTNLPFISRSAIWMLNILMTGTFISYFVGLQKLPFEVGKAMLYTFFGLSAYIFPIVIFIAQVQDQQLLGFIGSVVSYSVGVPLLLLGAASVQILATLILYMKALPKMDITIPFERK